MVSEALLLNYCIMVIITPYLVYLENDDLMVYMHEWLYCFSINKSISQIMHAVVICWQIDTRSNRVC